MNKDTITNCIDCKTEIKLSDIIDFTTDGSGEYTEMFQCKKCRKNIFIQYQPNITMQKVI
jgi:hypothetical protein